MMKVCEKGRPALTRRQPDEVGSSQPRGSEGGRGEGTSAEGWWRI